MRARWLGAVVVAGALVVATGGTGQAAFPGRNGMLAFDNGYDVMTVRPDGSGLHALTTDGASRSPRWSPDGRRLTFNRRGDIWVMNASGGQQRQITSGSDFDFNPAWSADGTRLAFVRRPAGGNGHGQLWVVPASGGTAIALESDPAGCAAEPVWSATGTQIFYWDQCAPRSHGSVDALRVLTVATGRSATVVGTAGIPGPGGSVVYFDSGGPDVTPDGRHLVFTAADSNRSGCGLGMTDLRGRSFRWVTTNLACEAGPFTHPAVSPDGSRAAYVFGYDDDSLVWQEIGGRGGRQILEPDEVTPWIYRVDWQPVR